MHRNISPRPSVSIHLNISPRPSVSIHPNISSRPSVSIDLNISPRHSVPIDQSLSQDIHSASIDSNISPRPSVPIETYKSEDWVGQLSRIALHVMLPWYLQSCCAWISHEEISTHVPPSTEASHYCWLRLETQPTCSMRRSGLQHSQLNM